MSQNQRPTDRIDAHDIGTRADLAYYLSRSLPGEYTTVVDEEVRQKATHVKTYLLEAHQDSETSATDRLSSVFRDVTPLTDRTLVRALDEDDNIYFFDLQNPRFQTMHSIETSSHTDQMFRKLTEGDVAGFDHLWMPRQFLEGVRRGQLAGFKFRYSTAISGVEAVDRWLIDAVTGEISRSLSSKQRFRMEVTEDLTADTEYVQLMEMPIFTGRKALEQIQFRSADEDAPEEYIVNSIYSYGKVVGKGTSVSGHFLTVDSVLDVYDRVLSDIEAVYSLGWISHNNGHILLGEPFIFYFPDDIRIFDLDSFAASIFSGNRPFRLFGVPHSSSNRRIDVEAIDLHTGDSLSLEITPDWMRVYLPRDACGNIIARLLTNLQHAVSSEITVRVGDNFDPFEVRSDNVE